MDARYGPPRAIRQTVRKDKGGPGYLESCVELWLEQAPTSERDKAQLQAMLTAASMASGRVFLRPSDEVEGGLRVSVVVRTHEDETEKRAKGA